MLLGAFLSTVKLSKCTSIIALDFLNIIPLVLRFEEMKNYQHVHATCVCMYVWGWGVCVLVLRYWF